MRTVDYLRTIIRVGHKTAQQSLLARVLATGVISLCAVCAAGCSKPSESPVETTEDVAPPKPPVQLPAPFDGVRLGTTEDELKAAFPPAEDISSCAPRLVGGDMPMPLRLPGYEKKPRSYCARSYHIGGITKAEDGAIDSWIEANKDYLRRNSSIDRDDYREMRSYAIGQIRGAVRSGRINDAAVVDAAHGKAATAFGSIYEVAKGLSWGGQAFSTANSARREVCALMASECDDLDPDRVRAYVAGEYSLGQIDADAHSRVVYGKCRNPYLKAQKRFAYKLSARAGAFPGIGLARASAKDRKLDPADAATYKVFASRSKLEPKVAKFGVMLANEIQSVEEYWKGSVAVLAPERPDATWRSAVVWFTEGRVSRILVNVLDDDKLGNLSSELAELYGKPGTTQGSVTRWEVSEGVTATLDIGAAASLVVQ